MHSGLGHPKDPFHGGDIEGRGRRGVALMGQLCQRSEWQLVRPRLPQARMASEVTVASQAPLT